MSYHDHDDVEPMDSHEFVENVKTEAAVLLTSLDPVWSRKFKNFIDLAEGIAFRNGFLWGAVASALIALVLLMVAR